MKNCGATMEKYLSLDKGEHIPLSVTLHLLICERCRNEVRFFRKAETAAASNAQVGITDKSISAVMEKIYASEEHLENKVSLSKWIIGGIVIMAMFLASAFFSHGINSNALKLCIYTELAVLITVYCALFIRSNMDFFVKLINAKMSSPSISK